MRIKKVLIYQSKDEEDYHKAISLLEEASIDHEVWQSKEPPLASCGVKVDVRSFLKKEPIKKVIYRIEVKKEDEEKALAILNGKVRKKENYGL
ncbi:MAG: hypothetical protein IJ875_06075 [Solobacterium sp.]|nr:hypothetical protein [Solobacterium sp.]